jgi:lipopolysaccharide/colanic/teichoic acid biosynthesis glycosyltransferase
VISLAPQPEGKTLAPPTSPTVWGLDSTQIYDRFWAARGVQIVRQGEPSEIVDDAELFLLTESDTLTIFRLGELIDSMSWTQPDIMFVRLHDERERGYRELVVADEDDRFVAFKRDYGGRASHLGRVAITPLRDLAVVWQNAPDARTGWRQLRRGVRRTHRSAASVRARVYDRFDRHQIVQCLREIVMLWQHPDATINRCRKGAGRVWRDQQASVPNTTRFIGPVWIGAGRELSPTDSVVGPAILWDDPGQRPIVDDLRWQDIEPTEALINAIRVTRLTGTQRALKRVFDVVAAIIAIIFFMPLFPIIAMAIWLEDGFPIFFAHRRETIGGHQFPCLKFRSMRNDAEAIKERLRAQQVNQADGPQFFMENDPRITRVGKFLRDTNLDELPQFLNVLVGHMSIVGPRPSPFSENQYCPPWREARLSVRPGITGLWQIKRSRTPGLDFQEWIRYDIEYVENVRWRMDLWIIWQTVIVTFKRLLHP